MQEAGIQLSDYAIETRKREIVYMRQAIMAFAYTELSWNQQDSADLFGKDRLTTHFSVKAINGELDLLKLRPKMVQSARLQAYLKLIRIKNNSITNQ